MREVRESCCGPSQALWPDDRGYNLSAMLNDAWGVL